MNDWIVANINNPNFELGDFRALGMDLDNTQLLSKDNYLKSSYIKDNELFKDDSGNFSEDKFNDFYDKVANDFVLFKDVDDQVVFDMFDITQYADKYKNTNKKIIGPDPKFFKVLNPYEQTIGYAGINELADSGLSVRELAQKNKVFDYENDLELDYTPNDEALLNNPIKWFKLLFSEPLVLALYDEDGTHFDSYSNLEVHHKKGDLKVNSEGKFYYETLSGRNIAGKKVLTASDIISVDGSNINKYDIFDSDGLDKNIGKVIINSALLIAPIFFTGPVGTIYSAALVSRELMKTFPMIDGLIGLFNDDDTQFTKFSNNLAGWATMVSRSLSDKANNKFFSVESLANLMTDVALQWGQQKVIAEGYKKLVGTKKMIDDAEISAKAAYDKMFPITKLLMEANEKMSASEIAKYLGNPANWKESGLGKSLIDNEMKKITPYIAKANRVGANISLAYMSLISNADVYLDLLDRGLTKKEAIAVALGSSAAMFAVDKLLHLGEIFFDELTADTKKALRETIKNKSRDFATEWQTTAVAKNKSFIDKIKGFIKAGSSGTKSATQQFIGDLKYHTLSAFEKGLGEGLEEVSEEVVTDMVKLVYELLGMFGVNTTTTNIDAFNDVFNQPENIKNLILKYAENFVGGFGGGELFYMSRFKQQGFKRDTSQDELIYLIRNNKLSEVINEIDKLYKKGLLGNTKLSTRHYIDNDGNVIFYTADNEQDSLNYFIKELLINEVTSLAGILKKYDLNKSEDDLYKTMVLDDDRFMHLQDVLQNKSYQTGYQLKYHQINLDIIDAEKTLRQLQLESDSIKRTDEWQLNINKAQQDLNDALQRLEDFTSGKTSIDYMGYLMFLMDSRVSSPYFSSTFEEWVKNNKNIDDLSNISTEDYNNLREEYYSFINSESGKRSQEAAYEAFKLMRKAILPNLSTIGESVREQRKVMEKVSDVFKLNPFEFERVSINDDFEGKISEDDRIPTIDLTDDLYNHRNVKLDGESDEDFEKRLKFRLNYILQQNLKTAQLINIERGSLKVFEVFDLVDKLDFIDSATKRRILLYLNLGKYDIVKQIVQLFNKTIDSKLDKLDIPDLLSSIKHELLNLNPDLNNLNDIANIILEIVSEYFYNNNPDYSIINLDEIIDYFDEEGYLKENYILEISNLLGLDLDPDNEYTQLDIVNSYNTLYVLDALNLHELEDAIRENESYKGLDDVDKKLVKQNPIIDILNKLNIDSRVSDSTIENLLNKLFIRLQYDSKENFILTKEELYALNDVEMLLYAALAQLYAAHNTDDLPNLFSHNPMLNRVAKERSVEGYTELPTIDDDIAYLYIWQIDRYLDEIGRPTENSDTGYNPGSWRDLNAKNAQTKFKLLTIAGKLLRQSKLDLLKSLDNSKTFVLSIKDKDGNDIQFNLFDGITIFDNDDDGVNLFNAEQTFYLNVVKLKNISGLSIAQIFASSNFAEFLNSDKYKNLFIELITAGLDHNISYDKFTPMDKLMILFSIMTEDANTFYSYIKSLREKEPDRVAFDVQLHDIRLIRAARNHTKDYSEVMNWASLFCKTASDIPVSLNNTICLYGNAGAGKTYCAGHYVASDWDDELNGKLILTAVGDNQLTNLAQNVKGTLLLVDLLIKNIYGDDVYNELKLLENSNDLPANNELKFFEILLTNFPGGSKRVILKPDIAIKNIDAIPHMVIMDEATYSSHYMAQLINNAVSKVNGLCILMGDNLQNGFVKNQKNLNIDQNTIFCGRCSRLNITLRDTNTQKLNFILQVVPALLLATTISSNTSEELRKAQEKKALDKFKTIQLQYFLSSSDINGDLIAKDLNTDIINTLKYLVSLKKTIAFIGDESSETYAKLKAALGSSLSVNPKTLTTVFTKELVQGAEFDYVVIDDNFDYNNTDLDKATIFWKNLYTLLTRAKTGAVLVDSKLQLKDIICTKTTTKSTPINFIKESLDIYKTILDSFLNKVVKEEQIQQQQQNLEPQKKKDEPKFSKDDIVLLKGNRWRVIDIDDTDYTVESYDDAENSIKIPIKELNLGKKVDIPLIENIATDTNPEEISKNPELHLVILVEQEQTELDDTITKEELSGRVVAYTENTLLGIQTTEDKVWKLSELKDSNVLEDVAAVEYILHGFDNFLDILKEEGSKKYELVKLLMEFKSLIYGNFTAADINDPRNPAINKFSKFFDSSTKDNLFDSGLKFKFVVRKKSENDHFVGYNDLSTDLMEIKIGDHEAKSYFTVVEFEKDGILFRIHLSMLGDPKHETKITALNEQINRHKAKIERLNTRIESLGIDDVTKEEIEELKSIIEEEQKHINSLESIKTGQVHPQYSFLDYLATNAEKSSNPNYYEEATIRDCISFSGSTELRNVVQNEFEVPRVRLLSVTSQSNRLYLNASTDEINRMDVNTFYGRNRYAVISDVYTYIPEQDGESILTDNKGFSLNGKSVVFVSKYPFLDKNILAQQWINELGTGKHTVRMLILDHAGIALDDLSNSKYTDAISTRVSNNGKAQYFPFETEATGFRQFIALWNFRAELLNFLTLVNAALNLDGELAAAGINSSNYKEALIHYSTERNKYIKNLKDGVPFNEYDFVLSSKDDKIKAIYNFNNSDVIKTNKRFRLGTSTNNSNGFFIGKIDKDTNGIYIDPETANSFIDLLENILNNSLGFLSDSLKNSDGTKLNSTLLISDYLYTFNSLIKTGSVEFNDGTTLDINGNVNLLHIIPTLILKLNNLSIAKNKLDQGIITEELWHDLDFHVSVGKNLYSLEQKNNEHLSSLNKLFNLCFHGTVEDFLNLDNKKDYKKPLLATVAPFKFGFYSDGMILDDGTGDKQVVKGYGVFYKTTTNPSMFTLKVSVDSSKQFIDVSKHMNYRSGKTLAAEPQENLLQESIISNINYTKIENIFEGLNDELLASTVLYKKDGSEVDIQKYLLSIGIQSSINEITFLDEDNSYIRIECSDNTTVKIYYNNNKISHEIIRSIPDRLTTQNESNNIDSLFNQDDTIVNSLGGLDSPRYKIYSNLESSQQEKILNYLINLKDIVEDIDTYSYDELIDAIITSSDDEVIKNIIETLNKC